MDSSPRNRMLIAFAPYALAGALHLGAHASIALGVDAATLVAVTKSLLMPALLLGFLLSARSAARRPVLLGSAAILLSWAGDVALMLPGEQWFLVGLCAFLAGHVFYVLLITWHLGVRRAPLAALAYAGWWIALVALLAPHVSWLVWPLAAYGLVLGLMAASATRAATSVAVGAFLFLVSDSVLAINRFMVTVEVWQPGLLVMSTYIVGQGLIAWGAARHLRGDRTGGSVPAASVVPVMRADAQH